MQDTDQEARMRAAAPPDPVTLAQTKVAAAVRDILATPQQHGTITVTVKVVNGLVLLEVQRGQTWRY